MNIGYIDIDKYKNISKMFDYINSDQGINDYTEGRFVFKPDNTYTIVEKIYLRDLLENNHVDIRNLKEIYIYGSEAELLQLDVLEEMPRLTGIIISNTELTDLLWIESLPLLENFTLNSTSGLIDEKINPKLYHPLRKAQNLKKLDLSFSSFTDTDIFLTNGTTIFDNMKKLEYLNLRETAIEDSSFLSFINVPSLLLNYIDNIPRLDFKKYPYINLVTRMIVKGGAIDISKYIGE